MLVVKVQSFFPVSVLFLKKSSLVSTTTAFFIVIFFLLTFHTQADTEFLPEDAYVSSGIGDARILIPFLADDATSSSICNLVFNGLTKLDSDLKIIADLAEDWEISQCGKEIIFFLRRDVKWHDGEYFTARDVKFTYELIMDPATACPYVSAYSQIQQLDIIDDHSIRFVYSEPYAPALHKLGMGIIPEHLFRDEDDLRNSKYARNPVGTGAYKFVEWKNGEYIILEANLDYFLPAPRIKHFVYRVIPDQGVQFLELVTGGVDFMELNPYQFLYRSETPEFKNRVNKYTYLSRSYTFLGYNLNDPILSDKKVRQALSYAINEEDLIESVLFGQGELVSGPFLKDSQYFCERARTYQYDAVKAAMLLREAGWLDVDGSGILSKDGRDLHIVISTNQGSQVREDAATIIQNQWSKLGVSSEIQVIAWSAFLSQFIDKRNFQAVILGWTLPVDPDLFAVWHSSSSRKGGLNFVSFADKNLDRLIEEGRREFSRDKRKNIYRQAHCIIAEEAPYTFLFSPYSMPAVNARFKGINPAPAGIGYNFIEWYVPDGEVRYKF